MHTQSTPTPRATLVRLDPGEDVLQALRAAVENTRIRNAVIVSGVGSLSRYRVHVVETTNMPPGNVFFGEDGPYDILSVTGLVVDGGIHAHIAFSDPSRAMGGHLEEGCTVLTFAVIALLETPDATLTGWDVRGPLNVG